METLHHNVKWQVSLSNGETFFEDKGQFQDIPGELSPWQRLVTYTGSKQVHITSLSLYTDAGQHFNLPSAGSNPKFSEFAKLDKPIDFRCSRKIAREMNLTGDAKPTDEMYVSDWYTVAEAIYADYSLQFWVDEMNVKNCWTLVVKHG